MSLRIFITGGSFDKEYDPLKEILLFREAHVKQMLDQGRCTVAHDSRTLMMVDSLDMNETDRHSILEACEAAPEDEIVITHGTSTMTETAHYLAEAATPESTIKDKTIVLTGAMIPHVFNNSDALFNLSAAMAFAQVLHPGVYIAMNGRYFLWNNVKKNARTGEFEELAEAD